MDGNSRIRATVIASNLSPKIACLSTMDIDDMGYGCNSALIEWCSFRVQERDCDYSEGEMQVDIEQGYDTTQYHSIQLFCHYKCMWQFGL